MKTTTHQIYWSAVVGVFLLVTTFCFLFSFPACTSTLEMVVEPNLPCDCGKDSRPHCEKECLEDLEYFKKDRYDGWDHRWPATWNQRMRYIGSSDAAFMVEVTQPNSNLARINRTNFFHHTDSYREDRAHHKVNRQILAIFREE